MEEISQETTPATEGGLPEEGQERIGEPTPDAPHPENQEEEPLIKEEAGPDYAEMAERDLSGIKEAFPELRHLQSLTELYNLARYAELREAGLSAVEAAAATQYERLRRPREDTRAHLSSSVPLHTAKAGSRISLGELNAARDLFPSLSDPEIEALYRRASGNRPQ